MLQVAREFAANGHAVLGLVGCLMGIEECKYNYLPLKALEPGDEVRADSHICAGTVHFSGVPCLMFLLSSGASPSPALTCDG